jgi:hypothetical protein
MRERTEIETAAIARFLDKGFDEGFTPGEVSEAELALSGHILKSVEDKFHSVTYILGLPLDFTVVAQKLSEFDLDAKDFRGDLDETALFARYPRTTSGTQNVNTLTLTFQFNSKTKKVGIRRVEEDVCDLFIAADRTGYPSAYVYNTGMWHHFQELLVNCFKLSESGRYLLCQQLIEFGLEKLPKNTFFGRDTPRFRLFEQIIKDYPRTATANENAGMVMQSIAYGYMKADRPHLSLIVDKSRTGSAKQRRFGDIDCYYGLDLEVSVEVKDEEITEAGVESELGQFARDVHRHRVQGLAFVFSIESAARNWLMSFGVIAQDIQTTLTRVESWDWRKQDDAVHGLLHFIAHVEQQPVAVTRLLNIIQTRDSSHDSLAYLKLEGSKEA